MSRSARRAKARSGGIAALFATALAAGALAACAPTTAPAVTGTPAGPVASSQPPSSSSSTSAPSSPSVLVTGLVAPWSVAPIGSGALISQRDDGRVLEWTPTGGVHEVGTVPDVVSGGEAGLNGLAIRPPSWFPARGMPANTTSAVAGSNRSAPGSPVRRSRTTRLSAAVA